MKYLCLVYSSEADLHGLPESPEDSECAVFDASLRDAGQWIAGEALQPAATAATVRVRGGRVSVTDGPFAETKEQLAGFWLIEAASRDEALAIAARVPSARVGSIEVRPIRQLDVPG